MLIIRFSGILKESFECGLNIILKFVKIECRFFIFMQLWKKWFSFNLIGLSLDLSKILFFI
jgi:hypothetical protein